MRFSRLLCTGSAMLALAGVLASAAPAEPAPTAHGLVGTWLEIESGTIFLFEADGRFTQIVLGGRGARGEYRADAERPADILLGPSYDVRFASSDGIVGAVSMDRPGMEPVEGAGGEFIHASAADPGLAQKPFAVQGSWIAQDGTSVMTFGADGTGSMLVLGRFGETPLPGAGTRQTFTYTYEPAEDGGIVDVKLENAEVSLAFVPWGPDVITVKGSRPGDPRPDPADLRFGGASLGFVRVVDVP